MSREYHLLHAGSHLCQSYLLLVDVRVRGALRLAEPRALTAQEICDSIKEHQSWRIDECQGPNKGVAAKVDSGVPPIVGHARH